MEKSLRSYGGPSTRLVYEQVRNVLEEQEATASALDTKASVFLALISAVVSIGIPLGLGQLHEYSHEIVVIGSLLALLLPIALLLRALVLGTRALRLREFRTQNDPRQYRERGVDALSEPDFYVNTLLNIEKTFDTNQVEIEAKTEAVTRLVRVAMMGTIAIGMWGLVVFLVTFFWRAG